MASFFEYQNQARRQTSMLLALFVLAIVALVGAALLVATLLFKMLNAPSLNMQTAAYIGLAVLVVVAAGTVFKLMQLSQGGSAVAKMLGASKISQDSRDPQERQLLNVVEEMCIAAGIGMLPVYVMRNETAINAFAAGYHSRDAVVAVTQGCLELLNRSELQGVIGHELSHVLNGDMRINIRMMGILHGIMLIGMIGYQILYFSRFANSNRRSNNNNALPILALAIGMIIIGYGGMFCANLIRAAISRQREFLADASAVQFTRNPDGIASALAKIAAHANGSKLDNPNSIEAAHMLFGSSVSGLFSQLLATHPPLAERIKRLKPDWNIETGHIHSTHSHAHVSGFSAGAGVSQPAQTADNSDIDTQKIASKTNRQSDTSELVLASIGTLSAADYQIAQQQISMLDEHLQQAARSVLGARALLYKLLLAAQDDIYQHQLQHIKNLDPDVVPILSELGASAVSIEPWQRLLYIDLALPQLVQISNDFYADFLELLDALIKADSKIELFEWCMYSIIKHYLDRKLLNPTRGNLLQQAARYKTLNAVSRECNMVFSLLSIVGSDSDAQQAAFAAGASTAQLDISMLAATELSLDGLSAALTKINQLYPLAKPLFLKACMALINSDGRTKTSETELLRAIAESIDCPIPPSAKLTS